jgi:hypothetical protein
VILTVEKSMKKSCSSLALVAISLTFNVAATDVGQDIIPELQRDPSTVTRNETLRGCVTRGPRPETYVLTNVTRVADGPAKAPAGSMTVVLSSAEVDFSRHLDHMVAVTGSQAPSWPPSGITRTEGDTQTNPKFTVTSLKMVADTCATPGLETAHALAVELTRGRDE